MPAGILAMAVAVARDLGRPRLAGFAADTIWDYVQETAYFDGEEIPETVDGPAVAFMSGIVSEALTETQGKDLVDGSDLVRLYRTDGMVFLENLGHYTQDSDGWYCLKEMPTDLALPFDRDAYDRWISSAEVCDDLPLPPRGVEAVGSDVPLESLRDGVYLLTAAWRGCDL